MVSRLYTKMGGVLQYNTYMKFNSFEQLNKLKDRFKDEKEVPPPPQNLPVGNENNDTSDSFTTEEKLEEYVEENTDEAEYDDVPQEKDVYLIGGSDAEMQLIKKRIKKAGQEYIDKDLKWGAKVEDYSKEISELLESGDIPVAIELAGAETIDGVVDIDHHNEKSGRPASLLQVMDRLGLKPSLFDELIAANDSAYIPGMEKKLEEHRYQIESKTGKDGFGKIKTKLINLVRSKDREAQGITKEQEKQAEEAIQKREDLYNNTLTIVRMPHSKSATVTDRAYGTYENLFVPSEDGESNFFGNGKLCKELHYKYQGSWAGGSGLGSSNGKAYWGGYPDQEEAEAFIKEKAKEISESFARFDSIFTPEDTSYFTELGRKVFEIGSFERMVEAVEALKIDIVNRGESYVVQLKAKPGWNAYGIDTDKLLGGDSKFMSRRREAQNTFGFASETPQVPSYFFLRESEEVSEKIKRGLVEIETLSFQKGGGYYDAISKFPSVERAISNKIEMTDPRLLRYPLGRLDISVQKTWETKSEGGYYSDPGDASLLNTCKDFELFGYGGYSTYSKIENLKSGNLEMFTPEVEGSAIDIKKWYERLEQSLPEFESATNRQIQEKTIEYLKRADEYVKKEEEELERMKSNPEFVNSYFTEATIDNPLVIDGTFEDFEKLNLFLKGKTVAVYRNSGHLDAYGKSDRYNNYSEYVERVGFFKGVETAKDWKDSGYRGYSLVSPSGLAESPIQPIDSGVSFSADAFAVDNIIDALDKAGYEVEGRGRSGFKSRNSFVVLLPKVTVPAHIIKYGESINGKEAGSEKVWYCGEVPIELNDQSKREEVLKIIDGVRQEERNKEIQEFVTEFLSRGDGTTALMRTGGIEKYQSIPNRFKELASIRVANTEDSRQNRSHAYENLLLDTEAIQGKKSITVKVPDNMKGLVIGKGGSNIKRLQEELGLQIRIV